MRPVAPAGLRRRVRICFAAFAIILATLGLDLFFIQVIRHPALAREQKEIQTVTANLLGARGTIFDRNGVPLAFSRISFSVFADPGRLDPKQQPAVQLASVLNEPQPKIVAALAKPGRFAWLLRRADDATVAQARELCKPIRGADGKWAPRVSGVGFKPEKKRLYPYGELAGQTIGMVRDDDTGGAGIEAACDRLLSGRDGYVVAEVDGSRRRRVIPGRRLQQVEPRPGRDVYLTIDVRIQEIAEAALRDGVQSCGAAGGTAVVVDPMTGDVLALANYPSADPNRYREYKREAWRNPAVVCVYEPGSTFKLVAACAALEYGGKTPESPVTTCIGSKPIGRRVIHCALHGGSRAHGAVDLHGVIVKSCNIGAATLALGVGRDKFYRTLRDFGFTRRTGIGLPAEAAGFVPPRRTWADIQLANLGFGQGITVTAPQLLAAYAGIAAGGIVPHVHLVDHIGRHGHKLAYRGHRAISQRIAQTMLSLLRDVVTEGTGKAAQVEGFTVAGKTGTAQKPVPGQGYDSGKYIGSFVGFAPAEDPRVAILVIMDEPKSSHYGGVVAAPVFADIARRSLAYMGMPPRLLAAAADLTR